MNKIKVYIDDIPDPSYVERFRQLGVGQYCIIYQNNVDPNAKSGEINVDAVIEKIESGTPTIGGGCSFKDAEIVVLDFEDPYFKSLMVGPEFSHTEGENTYTYHSTKTTLVNAITSLRQRYPHKQWGYYSMPFVPVYIAKEGDPIPDGIPSGMGTYISSASEDQIRNLKKHLTSSFRSIGDASDFVSTSVYQLDKSDGDHIGLDNIDRIRAEVGTDVCCNIGQGKRKFAWIAPVFFGLANATGVNAGNKVFDIIPVDEVIKDSVVPCVEHGMDGFFVWLAGNYRIAQITSPLNRGGHQGLRDWFNKNFLANTGAPSTDDTYWTAPHMVSAIKTIFTDWLYRFCERIVKEMEVSIVTDGNQKI